MNQWKEIPVTLNIDDLPNLTVKEKKRRHRMSSINVAGIEPKNLYSAKDVAALLNSSMKHVRNLLRDGKLKHDHVFSQNNKFISGNELLRYLETGKVTP